MDQIISTAPGVSLSNHELVLGEIWSRVLDRTGIGLTDNFFQLGGDSVKLAQMLTQARRAGLMLSMDDGLRSPTIAGLAVAAQPGYLDAGKEDEASIRELVLGDDDAERHTYVILTSGEDLPLVSLLAGNHRLAGYALHLLMPTWRESEPYVQPQTLAERFAAYLAERPDGGGYLVAGHCVAGPLAIRVADRLSRDGRKVAGLVVIDSVIPGAELRVWPLNEALDVEPDPADPLFRMLDDMTERRARGELGPADTLLRLWDLISAPATGVLRGALSVDMDDWPESARAHAARNLMAWLNLVIGMEVPIERPPRLGIVPSLVFSGWSHAPEIVALRRRRWAEELGQIRPVHLVIGHRALLHSDPLARLLSGAEPEPEPDRRR